MDQNEKSAVIKYLNLKGLSLNEISDAMKVVMGDDAPSYATIYRWIAEFKRGIENRPKMHIVLAAPSRHARKKIFSVSTTC